MFRITDGKGFHITFDNGWTMSVQWGYHNYCDAKDPTKLLGGVDSLTAEIAYWDANEVWHDFGSDQVKGYVSANEVARVMAQVSNLPNSKPLT